MKPEYINGPALILNSGSVSDHALANTNTYGKYSLLYTVGECNNSFLELKRIIIGMLEALRVNPDEITMPWSMNKKKMVAVKASSTKKPAIIDAENARVNARSITTGTFCKINVKPTIYRRQEVSEYINPVTFERDRNEVTVTGVMLLLNGLKLYGEEEKDLFKEE